MSWLARIAGKGSKPVKRATHAVSRGPREQPKVIVSESRLGILKCCTIHLVPILTTILILYLNLRGLYIGQDFKGPIKSETINLLLLQVAAKIHEILIGSSLALIVLHAVRYELLFGNGLPLGLVGSGLAFSNFQYFTKKEFLAAVKHWVNHENTTRKLAFVILLLVSGLTATLSGPASATLLVPKSQSWSSGGTEYFLNGTSDDFWPIDLTGDLAELQQVCNQNNTAHSALCPAGGFTSLWEHWGRTNFTTFFRSDVRDYAKRLSGSTFYWPIHSPASQAPPRYAMGAARSDDKSRSNTWLVLPHAAPATILQQITTDWWKALAPNDDVRPSEIDDREAHSNYLNAFTSVRCSEPQNISLMETEVEFPTLQGRFDYAKVHSFNVTNMNQTPTDHLRFQWVHLPDDFGALSIGGLFESPWINNDSRVVIGCSAQTGWVPAQTTTDEYSFWTGWYPWNVTFGDRLPFFNAVPAGQPLGKTNGRIALGDTWLNLLTPQTNIIKSTSLNPNPTTIESIFENAGLDTPPDHSSATTELTLTTAWTSTPTDTTTGTRTRLIEAILCSTLVDGLSRHGTHRIFANASASDPTLSLYTPLPNFPHRILSNRPNRNALAPPNLPPDLYITLTVTFSITGFSYKQSLAGALAITVLGVHLLLATAHIAWVLYTGQTSSSWTLISELIAIAYNSGGVAVCAGMENTGGAIRVGATFGRVVRVVVREDAAHGSGVLGKVEIVFDGEGEEGDMLGENGTIGGVVLADRRSSSISKASVAHASTWQGPYDTRAYTSSRDPLVQRKSDDGAHFGRVRVNRAYR